LLNHYFPIFPFIGREELSFQVSYLSMGYNFLRCYLYFISYAIHWVHISVSRFLFYLCLNLLFLLFVQIVLILIGCELIINQNSVMFLVPCIRVFVSFVCSIDLDVNKCSWSKWFGACLHIITSQLPLPSGFSVVLVWSLEVWYISNSQLLISLFSGN